MADELDPGAAALLDRLDAAAIPPAHAVTPETARRLIREAVADQPAPEVATVRDLAVDGPESPISVRAYAPDGDDLPTLAYFHGGGWVRGDLDSHDGFCRRLADAADCLVVAADYRRAPEHPFPAALDDCYAVTDWLADHATALGGDPGRLGVAGDSAGANLAAAVALLARERGGPDIDYQQLLYPVLDYAFDTGSYESYGDGYFLTTEAARYYWDQYLASDVDAHNPLAAPLRASDCSDLPPATVLTAGFDPLRDEGEAYADRLRDAGVQVEYTEFEGQIHGFLLFPGVVDRVETAVRELAEDVQDVLGR